MNDRRFLDTHVLIYAYDKDSPSKREAAQALLSLGIREERLVLSTQVLGEFFSAVTRKIREPMTPKEARQVISAVSVLPVVEIDLPLVGRAIDTVERYGIGYWDGLIIAAAESSGCREILSEDFSHGQLYHGIRVVNPFKDATTGSASTG